MIEINILIQDIKAINCEYKFADIDINLKLSSLKIGSYGREIFVDL